MIRRQTWVLFVILVVLLGVAFYLQKNPLPASQNVTPSPTAEASLLPDLSADQIIFIGSKPGSGPPLELSSNGGVWTLTPDQKSIESGKVEQIRTQIADMHTASALPADFTAEAGGLVTPAQTITLKTTQGKQVVLRIGKATPTGNGYYVQVDNHAPVIVNNGAIDTLLGLVSLQNLAPTPTPAATLAATAAATPIATPAP